MSFCPVLTGCDFSVSAEQIDTPIVEIYPSSKCIIWQKVRYARTYDIYINNSKCAESVSSSDEINSRLFDFSPYLGNEGEYTIKVIARSGRKLMKDSDFSEEVIYDYKYDYDDYSVPIPTDTSVEVSDSLHIDALLSGTRLTYSPIDDSSITAYKLYLYSAKTGLNEYVLDAQSVELQSSKYGLKNEIYAIRLGVTKGNKDIICTDVMYLNPENYAGFTDRIYTFDGYINDYYIDNLVELRNIVYYSFIYRECDLKVKLSESFEEDIISTYVGANPQSRLINAVVESFEYLYETRNVYDITCNPDSPSNRIYTIHINYNAYKNSSGLMECDLSNTPPEGGYYPELEWTPSYEKSTLPKRSESYDDFVSDKQFISTTVSSSEELYWAVENKVTPIVEENSMAERIYNIAKDTLREIISDSMTDYQKCLAIFDWISANTVYDYYSLGDDGETYTTYSVTNIPAYYLEGVFITGYAVCDGFSKAYSLLCNMEGIDAIRIVGTAVSGNSQGGHAWNKVLLDNNDGIGGEYYLVDITWSAIAYEGKDNEVSTHEYFLISDQEVASSHYSYYLREKFYYYYAYSNFNYYNNERFIYGGAQHDLIIDSDADARAVFYYMLESGLDTMEVVVDYNYMYRTYELSARGSSSNYPVIYSYSDIVSATIEKFRTLKFDEQYFTLHTNMWSVVRYTTKGVTGSNSNSLQGCGVILVLEQNFLIDAENEAGQLMNKILGDKLYGAYDLYITETMLGVVLGDIPEGSEGDYYETLASRLFANSISGKNVDVTFEYVGKDGETTYNDDGTIDEECQYVFKMYVSAR